MLDNPTVNDLLFHFATKLIAGAVLVYFWYAFIAGPARRFGTSVQDAAEDDTKSALPFPIANLLVLLVLSAGFTWYVGTEQAFREAQGIDNSFVQERDAAIEKADAEFVAPELDEPEVTEEEKDAAAIEKNREENAAAKKAFANIRERVESNGEGESEE